MTSYRGLEDLVKKAIATAMDDRQFGLAGIRFDDALVSRVMAQLTSPDRLNAAVSLCESEMRRWIVEAADKQDQELFGHARAALALSNKIVLKPGPCYREYGPGGPIAPLP